MPPKVEYQPGEDAPVCGDYQELNGFGTATGRVIFARRGAPLPPAPRGFSGRRLQQDDT